MLENYMKEQELDFSATGVVEFKQAHSEITKNGLVSEDDSVRIISLIVSAVRSNDECLAMIRKVELALQPPIISMANGHCDYADICLEKQR